MTIKEHLRNQRHKIILIRNYVSLPSSFCPKGDANFCTELYSEHVAESRTKLLKLISKLSLIKSIAVPWGDKITYIDAVAFMISSSVSFQFLRSPLINPEMMTNSSTSTFIAVKSLLTIADSFTPKARIPEKDLGSSFRNESNLNSKHFSYC